MTIRPLTILTVATTLACASTAFTQSVTFEFLESTPDGMAASDVSADGSVIVGNSSDDGIYETVRWTRETGWVRLGRATTVVLGIGAGTPDVSEDGTRVSATITNDAETLATMGIWTEGAGWASAEFPGSFPSDAGEVDNNIGSAWSISGDGENVVGLYWRAGATDGIAHAAAGPPSAIMDMGSLNDRSSRINDSNFDGSVLVGWTEVPFGTWQPTVWDNGTITVLAFSDAFTDAQGVSSDGDTIVGSTYDPALFSKVAARWTRDGKGGWTQTNLGALPGTSEPFGVATGNSVADNGMVVGYNRRSSPGTDTGTVWTEETGLQSADEWLEANGSATPEGFRIASFTSISRDGSTIVGFGFIDGTPLARSFRILIDQADCVGDVDGDGMVGGSDLAVVLGAWGTNDASADLDGSGQVDGADLAILLGAWGSCRG